MFNENYSQTETVPIYFVVSINILFSKVSKSCESDLLPPVTRLRPETTEHDTRCVFTTAHSLTSNYFSFSPYMILSSISIP